MTSAVVFGCEGPKLSAQEAAFFARVQPWGFILFARNIETPDQVRALTNDLRSAVGRDAVILIDQEGGRVQRMTPPHWRQWLPPLDQTAHLDAETAAQAMKIRYRLIAAELRAVGIDVNCAPMADLARSETHPILRNRCYGGEVQAVVSLARAVAEGLLAGGVLPVLKHMPGHGRATLDSHLEVPRVSTPRAVLEQTDFAAFRGLADLPLGMSAHVIYEDIDASAPGTVSSTIVGLVRAQIGFDGVLMTDDISMEALSGSVAERGQAALAAGCDMVLHCNGAMEDMISLAEVCPPLEGVAAGRASRALALRQTPEDVDLDAMSDAFARLTEGAAA